MAHILSRLTWLTVPAAHPRVWLAIMTLLQCAWYLQRYQKAEFARPDWLWAVIGATLLAGALVIGLPEGWVTRLGAAWAWLLRREGWLLVTLLLLYLLPKFAYGSLAEWRPDRKDPTAVYLASQQAAAGLVDFVVNYHEQQAWMARTHPPLAPLFFGAAMQLFGVTPLTYQGVSLVLGALVLLVVYAIGRDWGGRDWGGRSLGALAGLGLLTLPMFQRSALQDSNDLWMTLFFVLAVWRTGRLVQRPGYVAALLLGGILAAGLLAKYTMLLILPTMVALVWLLPPPGAPPAQGWAWRTRSGWLLRVLPYLAVAWGVGLAALAAWLVHAVQIGVLGAQVERLSSIAGINRNDSGAVRMLTERRLWKRMDLLSMRLPAALGVYAIPLLWQGALTTLGRRAALDVRVWTWLLIIFVPVVVTFPEPRYFMPAYAALTMLMALGVQAAPRPTARWLALGYCFGNLTLYGYVA
jgi:hypothetical protein